jgi:hypothetical protein
MLDNFLLTYHTTPHSTTGESPSKLFLGRELQTHFNLVPPDTEKKVHEQQAVQKQGYDATARNRKLSVGMTVTVKGSRDPTVWKRGVILQTLGPLSYLVRLDSSQVWRF